MALLLAGALAQASRSPAAARAAVALRRLALGLVVLVAGEGLLLLVTGARPREPLHFLYAGVALLVVPAATQLSRQAPERAGLYHALGGALLLGVGFRLLTTG